MRRRSKVLLLAALAAAVLVVILVVVGGGSPARASGGGTHYQHYPVADFNEYTQLFPQGGTAPGTQALAITSLTIDNPSAAGISVGVSIQSPCGGGGPVLTRVQIPAGNTAHLEYSGEPLIASGGGGRVGSDWCLVIYPVAAGAGNVIATIVGYTFKP